MKIGHVFRWTSLASLIMFTFASGIGASALEKKTITLSGCLIRGEGDGAGYLLSTKAFDPSTGGQPDKDVTPGVLGTSGNFSNVFYWLDGNRELRRHIGHRVEIEGEVKGDVKDGEMKIDRKDNWTEMKVKSDGRTMNARVPNTSIILPSDSTQKLDVLVRKVDVEHVRMLGVGCQ